MLSVQIIGYLRNINRQVIRSTKCILWKKEFSDGKDNLFTPENDTSHLIEDSRLSNVDIFTKSDTKLEKSFSEIIEDDDLMLEETADSEELSFHQHSDSIKNNHELLPKEINLKNPKRERLEWQLRKFVEKYSNNRNMKKRRLNESSDSGNEVIENKAIHLSNVDFFNKKLQSCLHIHWELGQISKALSILKHYHSYKNKSHEIIQIDSYNVAMEMFSEKGDFYIVKHIMTLIERNNLKPNIESYIHSLYCLGASYCYRNYERETKEIFIKMQENSVTFNDLFQEKYLFLFRKKYKSIIKAIHLIDSTYQLPSHLQSYDLYMCNLLNELNNKLHNCASNIFIKEIMSKEDYLKNVLSQLDIEEKGELQVPRIDENTLSNHLEYYSKQVKQYEKQWRILLREKLSKYIELKGNSNKLSHYPFLSVLSSDEYLDILFNLIKSLSYQSKRYNTPQTIVALRLGDQVYKRYRYNYRKKRGIVDQLKSIYTEYCLWFYNRTENDSISRITIKNIINKYETLDNYIQDSPKEWSYAVKLDVGRKLLKLLSTLEVDDPSDEQPNYVIYVLYNYLNHDEPYEIKLNSLIHEAYRKAKDHSVLFNAEELPMLSPPLPWIDINTGGYALTKCDFVRIESHPELQINRLLEAGSQALYPVFDALNVLGSVPWKINVEIFDLIIALFKEGKMPELDIPLHPHSLQLNKTQNNFQFLKEQREMYSLWIDAIYKLSLANFYRDKTFWFPFNLDFRGRCYPCPPHLTHFSSDIYRSIFSFAEGKKLGKRGIWWLKLHIINLTGLKKHDTFEARVELCEILLPEIIDSAENPLTGRKWWTKSDEPWQTLAACIELTNALNSNSPEDFISHLPIHQDGSCNGLQHYAALGRDTLGAQSVNLSPYERKMDVYSDICSLVEKRRERDACNIDSKYHEIANILDGFVHRKVVKQTVMTTVYGVTRYGAKLQILKQLKAMPSFPVLHSKNAAGYLTEAVFDSLGEIFSSAQIIQDWLTEAAVLITKLRHDQIEWVTPLGFPVVQAYFKKATDANTQIDSDNLLKPLPNTNKQKNGFPPNFIHSLDSTHLMLTGIYCHHAGITFAAIHDCFWTHCSSVEIMNQTCRNQFVSLHSIPILEDLADFLMKKHGYSHEELMDDVINKTGNKFKLNEFLMKPFPKGDFDINKVIDSKHFFS